MRNTAVAQRPTRLSAWDIPTKTDAQQWQRSLASRHSPAKASHFQIPKSGNYHRSQRIAKAAI